MFDPSLITGFDWDSGNERKNVDKHGVSQAEAEQVFFNQPLVLAIDERHSIVEQRYHALGRTDDFRQMHITFTLRQNGTRLRVISARDIRQRERKRYEKST